MIDDFDKTKEEQLKDFEEVISKWADKNCNICYGRGFSGWNEKYKRFTPCTCIDKNVQAELERLNMPEAEKHGVLMRFRQSLGFN